MMAADAPKTTTLPDGMMTFLDPYVIVTLAKVMIGQFLFVIVGIGVIGYFSNWKLDPLLQGLIYMIAQAEIGFMTTTVGFIFGSSIGSMMKNMLTMLQSIKDKSPLPVVTTTTTEDPKKTTTIVGAAPVEEAKP